MYFVYIIWSERLQKYYVGSTNDLEDRLLRHNSGEGNYTRKGIPWVMIWNRNFESRAEAFRLEQKIKARGIKRFLEDEKNNSGSSAGR